MANICKFEMIVIGNSAESVEKFCESVSWLDNKDFNWEPAVNDNYIMFIVGDTKSLVDANSIDEMPDMSKPFLNLADYSVRVRSKILNLEVEIHEWSLDSDFNVYSRYYDGKVLIEHTRFTGSNWSENPNILKSRIELYRDELLIDLLTRKGKHISCGIGRNFTLPSLYTVKADNFLAELSVRKLGESKNVDEVIDILSSNVLDGERKLFDEQSDFIKAIRKGIKKVNDIRTIKIGTNGGNTNHTWSQVYIYQKQTGAYYVEEEYRCSDACISCGGSLIINDSPEKYEQISDICNGMVRKYKLSNVEKLNCQGMTFKIIGFKDSKRIALINKIDSYGGLVKGSSVNNVDCYVVDTDSEKAELGYIEAVERLLAGDKVYIFDEKMVDGVLCGENETEITSEENTKVIKKNQYKGNLALTQFEIPEGTEVIEEGAFSGCKNLAQISIPSSVKYIGVRAFNDCKALKQVTIPESVQQIAGSAFKGSGLEAITIPSSVKDIVDCTFIGCKKLKSVEVKAGVESIGNRAFEECTGLTTVILPESINKIGEYCFYKCEKLKEIELPDDIATIPPYAYECSGLVKIKLPENLEVVGKYAFNRCASLSDYNLPKKLKEIHHGAFSFCKTGSLRIPNSCLKIEQDAFSNNMNLKEVIIEDGAMTEIEPGAFSLCFGLKKIKIPNTILHIPTELKDKIGK